MSTGATAAQFAPNKPKCNVELTPEPMVSIQLADEDEVLNTRDGSGRSKSSLYRRVWGSGPSPILLRHFQRYSLRGKGNKSKRDCSPANDTALCQATPLVFGLSQDVDTAESVIRPSMQSTPPALGIATSYQQPRNCDVNDSVHSCKSSRMNSCSSSPVVVTTRRTSDVRGKGSPAPSAAQRTQGAGVDASPASTAALTPEARPWPSPALSTSNRTPPGRARSTSVSSAAARTPEAPLPRVAYLTPGVRGSTPGSAVAYRTTASSPGPHAFTPPSGLRLSPHLGSGRKPIQYQPRGLAMVRYTAAGNSPTRSNVVATPSPGMARTLDGLLLAEDILSFLVAHAVEMAENGAQQSMQKSAGIPSSVRTTLAVVTEGDRGDAASEDDHHTVPNCRCNVM